MPAPQVLHAMPRARNANLLPQRASSSIAAGALLAPCAGSSTHVALWSLYAYQAPLRPPDGNTAPEPDSKSEIVSSLSGKLPEQSGPAPAPPPPPPGTSPFAPSAH